MARRPDPDRAAALVVEAAIHRLSGRTDGEYPRPRSGRSLAATQAGMQGDPRNELTDVLCGIRNGDHEAAERLLPMVYGELRLIAGSMFRDERVDHTLQPTALVHEAYLRMVREEVSWTDRAHFLAVAARAMRRLLIEHARKRGAKKRSAGGRRVPLDELLVTVDDRGIDLLILEETLERLARLNPRQARIVELRFFGGLTIPETAHVLGVGTTTVEDDWAMARAWLTVQLAERQP